MPEKVLAAFNHICAILPTRIVSLGLSESPVANDSELVLSVNGHPGT